MFSTTQKETYKNSLNKPTLQFGSQGLAVTEVQKLLKHWGAYRSEEDGLFDAAVEFAVKLFQFRVFLPDTGIVDQQTWQALYTGAPVNMPLLWQGKTGDEVMLVQEILRLTRHYEGVIDGQFGPMTDGAVRGFQRSFGVSMDGIVGSRTWHALSKIPRAYNPS